MERFHVLELIGEGSFGKVYKGRIRGTARIVALKFISKRGRTPRELAHLKSEIDIMRTLRHPNIILMLETFETANEV